MTKKNQKPLYVMTPSDLYEEVRRRSFDTRTSKAEIVREALREYLEREKSK